MRFLTLSLTLVLLLAAGPMFGADQKTKVPDADAQAKAEKLIKDIFKDDYAKRKPAEIQALAVKLHEQGVETKDDPAARYVLFREAMNLAAQVGDVDQALKAVEELAKTYAINMSGLKTTVFEKAAPAIIAAASNKSLVEDYVLPTLNEALAADDFETADRLLKIAEAAARKAKNVAVSTTVQARTREVGQLRKDYEKVKEALAVLEKNSKDAEANLTAGKHFCFVKGDWQKGLPLLVLGSDAKLKALAEKDLAAPTEAAQQVELADGWYDLAAGQDVAAKVQFQLRAYHWYEQALSGLSGLSKTKVEKRLAELEKVAEGLGGAKSNWFVIFRSADPAIWNKDVNKGKDSFAIDLKKVPDKIEYLKLTNVKNNDYVIVPITRDKLTGITDGGRYGWNGTNKFEYNGYHLGIYDKEGDATKGASVCVLVPGAFQGWRGWGFGHKSKEPGTGHTWANVEIPSTVFEIAVKPGPLTDAESKRLLRK